MGAKLLAAAAAAVTAALVALGAEPELAAACGRGLAAAVRFVSSLWFPV